MSTATRKSSQNRRTTTIDYLTSLPNSTSEYNSKLRTSGRSKEVNRAEGSNRQLGSCDARHTAFLWRQPDRLQENYARKRARDTRATTGTEQSRGQRPRLQRPHFSLLAFQRFSFSTEPVFRPGIGGIAVATDLPETGLVFGDEINRANKLGPFPCIKLRDNHARGTTVIARNRFAVELRRHERVVIERVFDSDITAIAIVAAKENVVHFRFRFHNFCQCEKGDTAPATIEFAPGRDAMEIGDVFKLRECIEFFPGECLRIFHQPADFQAPIFQRNFRFDAEIENREPLGEMLARRKAFSRASEPDRRISGPDWRFFFGSHFARPTFLALDHAWVRRRHKENLNRAAVDCADFLNSWTTRPRE